MDDQIEQDDLEVQEDEEIQQEVEEQTTEPEPEDDIDWRERALKAEKAIENAKKKTKLAPQPSKNNQAELDDDVVKDVQFLKLAEKKRQFGYAYGLSPEEADKVFSFNPNPDADTLKDPFIQAGLQAIRKQRKVQNNTPSSSAKATFIGDDFHKKSDAEKQQEFEKYVKAKARK